MYFHRKFRSLAGWLAIMVMALNALWPLVAGAKPSRAFDPSTEICTTSGIKHFGGGTSQPADAAGQAHCAFCTLGANDPALPAGGTDAGLVVPQPDDSYASIEKPLPQEPSGYPSAPPRAPPAFS